MDYIKIGNIAKSIVSGGTPKSTKAEYYNGNIPWLNTKEINFNRIYRTEKCITTEGLNNSSAKYIKENCVIIAMYGATAGRAAINKISLTTNQACCNIEVDSSKMDYNYVYYAIKNDYEHLSSLANGGAQQNLNSLIIKDFEIPYVNLYIQKKISKILTSIDKKIELNNEINNNLYELCRKIFEQTFNYDMSFESLDSLCSEITRGYTKNYVEKSNLINLNQKVNKGQNLEKQYYKYLDENQDIPKNRYVRKNDILLNSLGQGTLGRVHLFEENVNNVVIDQHISILRTGARISPYYLYYLLSSNEYQNKIENSVTGTTGMLMLNISVVRSFKIPVPNKKDIDYFDSIAKVCMDKITINTLENEKLIELRDILLPKLMNGEIDLDNIEI